MVANRGTPRGRRPRNGESLHRLLPWYAFCLLALCPRTQPGMQEIVGGLLNLQNTTGATSGPRTRYQTRKDEDDARRGASTRSESERPSVLDRSHRVHVSDTYKAPKSMSPRVELDETLVTNFGLTKEAANYQKQSIRPPGMPSSHVAGTIPVNQGRREGDTG